MIFINGDRESSEKVKEFWEQRHLNRSHSPYPGNPGHFHVIFDQRYWAIVSHLPLVFIWFGCKVLNLSEIDKDCMDAKILKSKRLLRRCCTCNGLKCVSGCWFDFCIAVRVSTGVRLLRWDCMVAEVFYLFWSVWGCWDDIVFARVSN